MNSKIKVLVVGDFLAPIHEDAICTALGKYGLQVDKFKFSDYLRFNKFWIRKISNLQLKLRQGPKITKINKDLRKVVRKNSYDFIFFYRPRIIKEYVLSEISPKTAIYFYNNDDPFGKLYHNSYWKDYFGGLKYCTHIFYYRKKNKFDYQQIGFNNTSLFRSYFIKSLNFPTSKRYKYDVVFIGHFENDNRDLWLKFLLDNGVNLKIFGPEWHRSSLYNFFTEKMGTIIPLKKEYNQTLNDAKIALVFLSSLNSDTYTRRCFEIPATKTMMLAKYSDDLAEMFTPGVDADYFHTKEELLKKVNLYLSNDLLRDRIADNGHMRVNHDNHEVTERVKIILAQFEKDKTALNGG